VFLVIDALRSDRAEAVLGEGSVWSEKLSNSSLTCPQMFSLAPSTQPSLPSLWSSTRPLDFGGYDFGVRDRPDCLGEVFRKNGYTTRLEASIPWLTNLYGYTRGMDSVGIVFDITLLVNTCSYTLIPHLDYFHRGQGSFDELVRNVSKIIENFLKLLISYCSHYDLTDSDRNGIYRHSNFIKLNCKIEIVRLTAEKHLARLNASPRDYVESFIKDFFGYEKTGWLAKEVKYNLSRIDLITERLITRFLKLFSIGWFPRKVYVDAEELANGVIRSMQKTRSNKSESQPFFIATHFMDTHFPYCPGEQPFWFKNSSNYLFERMSVANILRACHLDSGSVSDQKKQLISQMYDGALRYVFAQIARIIQVTEDMGIADQTLFVITGDHGEEIFEHGQLGHRFRFYDECIKTFSLFYQKGMSGQRYELCADLRDVPVTMLAMAGLEIPRSFQGKNLAHRRCADERGNYVQMEVFHRGGCDFVNKPIYSAVRTSTHKTIVREWIDSTDTDARSEIEIYDLVEDPLELNPVCDFDAQGVPSEHAHLIARRVKELKSGE